MHDFDTKDVQRLCGLPVVTIRSLVRAGHVRPVKVAGKSRYSFQDLLVLRTASALRAAKVPAHKINRALRMIREAEEIAGQRGALSVTAVGRRIAVQEGRGLRDSETGQYALPLEAAAQPSVHAMRSADDDRTDEADASFTKGVELEDANPAGARGAYVACLAIDARHVGARLNLGRLLHLSGELAEAERIYRGSAVPDAQLSFNRALVLEDLARGAEAMLAYREAIALDPGSADAHFNLARLCALDGDARSALRHLLAYRRLVKDGG